jgi:hypothetical protein
LADSAEASFYNDLEASLAEAWRRLEDGVRNRKSGFHTVQLATVATDGAPNVRTCVLRAVDPDVRWLQVHTDRRGRKPVEIAQEPRATIHGYDALAKIQVRATGTAVIHADDEVAEAAWARTRWFSRECYRLQPGPGTPIEGPDGADVPEVTDQEIGRENFAVLRLWVDRMEWLYLAAAGHRRALFDWSTGTRNATWLVP